MNPELTPPNIRLRGFALIEVAIALFVISIVLAGMIAPITAQVQQRKVSDTQRILEEAKEAIMGFVVANGRLPCPASAGSNGVESPAGGTCTNPFDGFLPAATIGITSSDGLGYATDAWNSRIRYAVTKANANAFTFTTAGGMKAAGMAALSPNLQICSTATGITATTCAAGKSIATNAVAVIYSLGPNAVTGGTGADEAANLNADQVFISHTQSSSGSGNGEFDDLVTWISPYVLYSRMVNAGMLP